MVIGFEMFGYDNDSYMTGSCDKLFEELTLVPKCAVCGYRTDYRYTNKDFVLRRKTLDFSATYDGITIVSLKFKEFAKRYGYNNLQFVELPKAPNFFQFYVQDSLVEYSAGLKEDLCNACGQYESIVVPSMKVDTFSAPLDDGFYQSGLWFGSRNEKSPIIVIAPATKEKIAREKFKNIILSKVEKR